jgi:hypothetical protein
VERKGKIMVKRKQNPWSLRRRKNGLSTICVNINAWELVLLSWLPTP